MLKLISKSILLIIALALVLFLFGLIVPNQYDDSFQSVISRQYDSYKEIEGEKITVLGGSSLSFGFNMDYMAELADKPVQILGLHGSIGLPYLMQLTKANIDNGDIIIIEIDSINMDAFGSKLLLTGIEKNVEMYKYFTWDQWKEVLKMYPTYIHDKLIYFIKGGYKPDTWYSADLFDEKGNMINNIDHFSMSESDVRIYLSDKDLNSNFDEEFVEYINEYTSYCESLGASVYLTYYPVLDEAVDFSPEAIKNYDAIIKETYRAPLISELEDYIYEREFFGNAHVHSNTHGAQKRTKLLYEDLMDYKNN